MTHARVVPGFLEFLRVRREREGDLFCFFFFPSLSSSLSARFLPLYLCLPLTSVCLQSPSPLALGVWESGHIGKTRGNEERKCLFSQNRLFSPNRIQNPFSTRESEWKVRIARDAIPKLKCASKTRPSRPTMGPWAF